MKKHNQSQRQVLVNNLYPSLAYNRNSIDQLFACLDEYSEYKIPSGELHIAFLDDPHIIRLHEQFLNDPTPTDVITFPGDPDEDLAGEICISIDHTITASEIHNNPFENELTLYLVHGWLHLAGINDKTEEDRKIMRKAESSTLQLIETHDCLPNFTLKK